MVTEAKLKEFGFTNFLHLQKTARDGKSRLIYTTSIRCGCLTVLLVQNSNTWTIDKITFDGDKLLFKEIFPLNPSLEDIFNFLIKQREQDSE
ncbi:hypothetical protein [Paraflavitalea speifideaquila]|uniref:hypothetical protein n=1 Tax=Paraflavitalea speifideaquila TaxID=3076558 RepID=UPI0028EC84DF|nr:hypothetical protein [Paraflavitalea speifideiaquila]